MRIPRQNGLSVFYVRPEHVFHLRKKTINNFVYCSLFCYFAELFISKCKKMSTISVTVEQPNHALMLVEWLKNIRFVKEVNIEMEELSPKGNAAAIKKALDEIKSKNLFSDIDDPVAYQRQLRDEWN